MAQRSITEARILDEIRKLPQTKKFLMFLAYADASMLGLPHRLRMKAAFETWPSQYITEVEKEFHDRAIKKLLNKLKENRFLTLRKTGRRMYCALTDKGRMAVMRERIRLAPKLADKTILVISFDVPERERVSRDVLRRFLRYCGFRRWHDSLWVTDMDVRPVIKEALTRMGVGRWVTMYQAHEII